MLARARRRTRRSRHGHRLRLVRGDIRHLPFPDASFGLVMAPYGILQSLLRERDLEATLDSVARVLTRGSVFGFELVADLPTWSEYRKRTRLSGRRAASGARVTLIETVRQDRGRRLTVFEQEFVERRNGTSRRKAFTIAFRTLSMPQMTRRLRTAGFEVTAILGDYQGGPWDPRADVWIVLARKARRRVNARPAALR
jgi:ubiquinone/menaquinone biosynthesis C-methylase UbiE